MARPRWHEAERDGARLACATYKGDGPQIVLLHGLAGYALEWAETASWLRADHSVIAPDQRGQGKSERRPNVVSRRAYVADVEMWIERLAAGPVVLVGQSLGGHTAFLLAAQRPDLVRGLVVVEATPAADPTAPDKVRKWFESWPVPFRSPAEARDFFGGSTLWARTWAAGLERRDGGLWPRFEVDVMVDSLEEVSHTEYWDDWARVGCPSLIVRAESGISRDEVRRMQEVMPAVRIVEVAKSQHDVHLEQPRVWQTTLQSFLADLA